MSDRPKRTRGLSDVVERILEARSTPLAPRAAIAGSMGDILVTPPAKRTIPSALKLSESARRRIRRALLEQWRELNGAA